MITITIENKCNDKIKLTVEGQGTSSELTKEATFLIGNSNEIYEAVIDKLPPYAQMKVLLSALENLKEDITTGEHDD